MCAKSFSSKGNLTQHMQQHTRQRPFNCPECGKWFFSMHNVNRHVDTVHKKLKPFNCRICGKSFGETGSCNKHIDSVHRKLKQFSCTKCGKSFARRENLDKHVTSIHKNTKQKRRRSTQHAAQNKDKSKSRTFYKSYKGNSKGEIKPFSCLLCNKSFASKRTLTRHIDGFHQNQNSKCAMCLASFHQSQIENHLWECQAKLPCLSRIVEIKTELRGTIPQDYNGDTDIASEMSGSSSQQYNDAEISRESKLHNKMDDRKLQIAEPLSDSEINEIKPDILSQPDSKDAIDHIAQTAKQFKCSLYTEAFTVKRNLTKHMKQHTKKKSFSCPLCQKRFCTRSHVNRHIDTVHKKLRPFKCRICRKSFGEKGTCDKHFYSVHKQHRPFPCKSFAKGGTHYKHVGVHKNARPKPKACLGKLQNEHAYAYDNGGKIHPNAGHQKAKYFSCTLCNMSFASKQNLTIHIDVFHHKPNSKCAMCLNLFYQTQIENHLWECQAKLPCLRRIDEIKRELREEFTSYEGDNGSSKQYVATCSQDIHPKNKPFCCTFCTKSFSHKSGLTEHTRFHTKEKLFSCYICRKLFYKKQHVNTHINAVHKKIRYSCTICTLFPKRNAGVIH